MRHRGYFTFTCTSGAWWTGNKKRFANPQKTLVATAARKNHKMQLFSFRKTNKIRALTVWPKLWETCNAAEQPHHIHPNSQEEKKRRKKAIFIYLVHTAARAGPQVWRSDLFSSLTDIEQQKTITETKAAGCFRKIQKGHNPRRARALRWLNLIYFGQKQSIVTEQQSSVMLFWCQSLDEL